MRSFLASFTLTVLVTAPALGDVIVPTRRSGAPAQASGNLGSLPESFQMVHLGLGVLLSLAAVVLGLFAVKRRQRPTPGTS